MNFTYVLLCRNKSTGRQVFYVGVTEDINQRLGGHKSGKVRTPSLFDSIELVYYEMCLDKKDARLRELQLKTGFGRSYIKRRLKNYLSLGDASAGVV